MRGAFGPLLRAATQQLLLRRLDDPYGFLVEWLYSVSTSAAGALQGSSSAAEVTEADRTLTLTLTLTLTPNPNPNPNQVTEADLALRRQEISAAHAALARVLKQIAASLPAAEQVASASLMLDYPNPTPNPYP